MLNHTYLVKVGHWWDIRSVVCTSRFKTRILLYIFSMSRDVRLIFLADDQQPLYSFGLLEVITV